MIVISVLTKTNSMVYSINEQPYYPARRRWKYYGHKGMDIISHNNQAVECLLVLRAPNRAEKIFRVLLLPHQPELLNNGSMLSSCLHQVSGPATEAAGTKSQGTRQHVCNLCLFHLAKPQFSVLRWRDWYRVWSSPAVVRPLRVEKSEIIALWILNGYFSRCCRFISSIQFAHSPLTCRIHKAFLSSQMLFTGHFCRFWTVLCKPKKWLRVKIQQISNLLWI